MKQILAPIDFSDVTEQVLAKSAEMAKAFGASIALLHVIGLEADLAGFAGDAPYMNMPMSKEIVEVRKLKAAERMEELVKGLLDQGLSVECEVAIECARPASAVLESVRKHDADLIVIGTHGHGALFHLLLGGVAQTVIRCAPCPVLVVHSIPHKDRPELVKVSHQTHETHSE